MSKPSLHDDPKRTTSIGMARYATEFFQAAIAADEAMGSKKGYETIAPIPVMFLVGQSIELILKAFLLHKGVALQKVRQTYGHDLHKILRKAKELGLSSIVNITDEEQEIIELLNTLYSSKQLQYIVTGGKTYPVFGPLESLARKMLITIGAEVGFPARNIG